MSETGTKLSGGPYTQETRKDILSPHEWQRRSGVELVKNRVDLAGTLGAPDIVLHIDITDAVFCDGASENAFFTPLFTSLDELRPYCLEHGVRIAVENLCGAGAESFLALYDRLFARYDADFLGVCYDSGHWEMIEPGALNVLDRFGERLIATHIHDNFGATDDHLLPSDGRLDWDRITRAIAGTPYITPLNLETPKDRYGMAASAFYHRAYQVASRLEAMLDAARRNEGRQALAS